MQVSDQNLQIFLYSSIFVSCKLFEDLFLGDRLVDLQNFVQLDSQTRKHFFTFLDSVKTFGILYSPYFSDARLKAKRSVYTGKIDTFWRK